MIRGLLKFSDSAMEIQQPLILIDPIHLRGEGFSSTDRPDNRARELSRVGLDCEGSLRSCSVRDVADTVASPTVSLGGTGPDSSQAVANLTAGNVGPGHRWGNNQPVLSTSRHSLPPLLKQHQQNATALVVSLTVWHKCQPSPSPIDLKSANTDLAFPLLHLLEENWEINQAASSAWSLCLCPVFSRTRTQFPACPNWVHPDGLNC